jgi:SAM-dependent methyltransferase
MYDERQDFDHHRDEVADAFGLLDSLGVQVPATALLLDVGGGKGMHCGFLQGTAHHVVCGDILGYGSLYEGQFHKLIAEKHQRNGVNFDLDRCAFIQTDAMNLMFRDGWFDAVFSFNAFEHIPDPARAFAEVARVLKPGGFAYITLDPIWTCDTGSHFFGYVPQPWQHLVCSPAEYRAAMAAGGASAGEVEEFPHAMNGKRLKEFRAALDTAMAKYPLEVVHAGTYAGLSNESHLTHPNFARAIALGYTEEELRLRRLRWVLRRRG